MPVLHSLDEVWEQGLIDGAALPPLSQEQANQVAAILAPHLRAREPQAA